MTIFADAVLRIDMKEIIKQIEIMRIHLGYSKRRLSKEADISEEYYWRIITGKAPGCAAEIIERLAKSVGIEIVAHINFNRLEEISNSKGVRHK